MPDYDGVQLCAVADNLGNMSCQWPFLDVNIFAEGQLGQIDLVKAVELAVKGWNDICGLRLKHTTDKTKAHIVITRASLDGSGSVLADSQLPCGFTASQWNQLRQRYDTGEAWVISDNPPGNKIDAVRVIMHELGHAIGIGHINSGNLMAPTYSTQIRLPQNGDIMEARARYGKPVPVPTPPGVPPVVGDLSGEILVNGQKYTITGKRVG